MGGRGPGVVVLGEWKDEAQGSRHAEARLHGLEGDAEERRDAVTVKVSGGKKISLDVPIAQTISFERKWA